MFAKILAILYEYADTRIVFIFFIRIYRLWSIFSYPRCRFYPSCSKYAIDAFQNYTVLYSLYLIFRRLMKCHPFFWGELYDPIPSEKKIK